MFWFVLVNEMMIQIVFVFNAVLKSLFSIMMRRFKGSHNNIIYQYNVIYAEHMFFFSSCNSFPFIKLFC